MACVACIDSYYIRTIMTLTKYLDNIVQYIYCNVVVLSLSYFMDIFWTKIDTIDSMTYKSRYMGHISKYLPKIICITHYQSTLYMHYSGIMLCSYGVLQSLYQNTHIEHNFSTFFKAFH